MQAKTFGCAFAATLFFAFTASFAQEAVRETLVVELPVGTGPGQVIVAKLPGVRLSPRCFGVDAQGVFYVPETDADNRIRVHKFAADGRFIEMLRPEGIAQGVDAIVIDGAGRLYLSLDLPGTAKRCIGVYSPQGRLLESLGPNGPIKSGSFTEAELFDSARELILTDSGEVAVVSGGSPEKSTITLIASNGTKDAERRVSAAVQAKRTRRGAVEESKRDSAFQSHVTDDVLLPDGTYYYLACRAAGDAEDAPLIIFRVDPGADTGH